MGKKKFRITSLSACHELLTVPTMQVKARQGRVFSKRGDNVGTLKGDQQSEICDGSSHLKGATDQTGEFEFQREDTVKKKSKGRTERMALALNFWKT